MVAVSRPAGVVVSEGVGEAVGATSDGVDVDAVQPRCHALDVHVDVYRAGGVLGEAGVPDLVAVDVLQHRPAVVGAAAGDRGDGNRSAAQQHELPPPPFLARWA